MFLSLASKTISWMLATSLLRHVRRARHVSEDGAACIKYTGGRPGGPEVSSAARKGGRIPSFAPKSEGSFLLDGCTESKAE